MKDKIFVQFFSLIEDSFTSKLEFFKKKTYYLHNGFSYVYNECKEAGDFYWVDSKPTDFFPISSGEAYISTLFSFHILQTFVWAQNNPDVKFIVGGPSVRMSNPNNCYRPIPKNVEFRYGLAEKDIFGKEDVNCKWQLDLPENLNLEDIYIFPSYVLDRGCYWGRCIFCYYPHQRDNYEPSYELSCKGFLLDLVTGSISPESIRKIPKLMKNGVLGFGVWARSDLETLKLLPNVLNELPDGCVNLWRIGVEFPSNRMLSLMRKGTTIDIIKKTIEILSNSKDSSCSLCFILGWNILEEEDIKCLEDFVLFLKNLSPKSTIINIDKLDYGRGVISSSAILELNTNEYFEKEIIFPYYSSRGFKSFIYVPIMNERQKELNNIAHKLLLDTNIIGIDKY